MLIIRRCTGMVTSGEREMISSKCGHLFDTFEFLIVSRGTMRLVSINGSSLQDLLRLDLWNS